MTEKELSEKLDERYFNAPKGEAAKMIYLFGILYANELSNFSIKDIVVDARLYESFKLRNAKE